MPLTLEDGQVKHWKVRKIGVVGPGIVGMPMAALLAHARVREGSAEPARVLVIQRDSPTSGWKVDAINAARSPIGGVEPDLDRIVADTVGAGLLKASHDYADLADADVVLVCVQTDKKGIEPDYGPLFESLEHLARSLQSRPAGNIPLVIFESTLAPSSMATLIRELFAGHGLREGRDVLLGNSPNRVMPGRLVDRVASSDKIVAGLEPRTPELIRRLYGWIVTRGTLYATNSLTAEVVKTLENAYRDVRIAYAAEIVRYCDLHDIDFFQVRDAVNLRMARTDGASLDPTAVPVGGLLVPTVGVGGHCLPKDGILLWWRRLETGDDSEHSLILASRRINDESPEETVRLAERSFGDLGGRSITLLGAAYRGDSEDTRNSPALVLARILKDRGAGVTIHDPHVRQGDQNLARTGMERHFTGDLTQALYQADLVFSCAPHQAYLQDKVSTILPAPRLKCFVDGCNLFQPADFAQRSIVYVGVGRGRKPPTSDFTEFTLAGFRAVERGFAGEIRDLVQFLNARYAGTEFEKVDFQDVQRLAATCSTGCDIVDPEPPEPVEPYDGFLPRLVRHALQNSR